MFGCCVAGRLLQTNLQQVDETHALFEIPDAGSINHICVFLLGTVPFPDGYGATVHFFWPGKGFQLLGMLSNEKPSAIFRLRGTYTSPNAATTDAAAAASDPNSFQALVFSQQAAARHVQAILGISIEPLHEIQSQLASIPTASAADPLKNPAVLAERIGKNLFNYVAGFASDSGPSSVVPLNAISRWYDTFTSKVRAGGTAFLEKDN